MVRRVNMRILGVLGVLALGLSACTLSGPKTKAAREEAYQKPAAATVPEELAKKPRAKLGDQDRVERQTLTSSQDCPFPEAPEHKRVLESMVAEPLFTWVDDGSQGYLPLDLPVCEPTRTPQVCRGIALLHTQSGPEKVLRWNPKKLPVAFQLAADLSQEDREMWARVVERFNRVAHEEGLVPSGQALVTLTQNAPNMIGVGDKPDEPDTGGETRLVAVEDSGEITDADIVIYKRNIADFVDAHQDLAGLEEGYLEDAYELVAMHEMGHALGMGHNHAPGFMSFVSGPPLLKRIPETFYFPSAPNRAHDREVLKYLYKPNFPSSSQPLRAFHVVTD